MRQAGARRIQKPNFFFVAIVALALSSCSTRQTSQWKVLGESMEPNFHDGEVVKVEQVELSELQRGDVVLYQYDADRLFIKRLIGLPGDTIEIGNGEIIINGEVYDEPFDASSPSYERSKLTLRENEYYVLGDNRDLSSDSHSWGALSGDNIRGRVVP